METFSALLAICAGNSPVPGEFPTQRPVTRSFDVFFDLRLNKRLSIHSWGWWFETLPRPVWRHSNVCRACIKYPNHYGSCLVVICCFLVLVVLHIPLKFPSWAPKEYLSCNPDEYRSINHIGLLPDAKNFVLRMRRECRKPFPPPPTSKETAS